MSPKRLRTRNLRNYSNTPISNRSKIDSSIILDKKNPNSSYNEKDLENQENDQTNTLLLNDSFQQKYERVRITRSSKKKMQIEKSKNTRNKNMSIKNSELQDDVVGNNTLVNIDNMAYEVLEQSPVQIKDMSMHWNRIKRFKKSPANHDLTSKEENIHNSSLNGTITPKYKPVSVTLTPPRTTKTPKRSPMNLGSPKKHSEVSFKLSKTPRKLQLFNNSPTESSSPNVVLRSKKHISNNIKSITLGNMSVHDVNAESNKLNVSVHKPSNNVKSLPSEESQLELTLTNENDLSEVYKELISKKPIVLLERIPLLDSLSVSLKSLKTQSNQYLIDTTLDVAKHVQKQLFNNLSTSKDSSWHITHKNSMITEDLLKSFNNNTKNAELNNTSFIVSSTPVNRRNSKSSFTPVSFTDEKIKPNFLLENEMKNSTYVMNETNNDQNNTMVFENEDVTNADVTYELLKPRTPHLRRRYKENETAEVDNDKNEIKNVFKVRFFTPKHQIKKLRSNSNIAIRKTPRIEHEKLNSVSNTLTNKGTPNSEFKRRSISKSNLNKTSYMNGNKEKRRTPSSISIQMESNTENEGKKDVTAPKIKKKIPNFVEIHKQMFAKMESIADNKNRIIQKHEALRTPKASTLSKILGKNTKKLKSKETKNETYNRFGFRVRKADATNIILQKKQTDVQKKKREENKAILEGVRTNRRFELLMKMRKIYN